MEKLLSEFLTDIFERLTPLRGKKYSDGIRDFHFDMSAALDKYLQELQLEYHIFAIAPLRDSELYNKIGNIDLFKISLPDFIQDKRVKMGKVGKVVTISCECAFDCAFSETLSNYFLNVEKTQLQEELNTSQNSINGLRKQLTQAEDDYNEVAKKLDKFNQQKK